MAELVVSLSWTKPERTTNRKGQYGDVLPFMSGAGEESRTLDLNLGKVALYQLSYSRIASFVVYTGISVFSVQIE